jgi:hypothetical protein
MGEGGRARKEKRYNGHTGDSGCWDAHTSPSTWGGSGSGGGRNSRLSTGYQLGLGGENEERNVRGLSRGRG